MTWEDVWKPWHVVMSESASCIVCWLCFLMTSLKKTQWEFPVVTSWCLVTDGSFWWSGSWNVWLVVQLCWWRVSELLRHCHLLLLRDHTMANLRRKTPHNPFGFKCFFACQRQGKRNCARRTFVIELTWSGKRVALSRYTVFHLLYYFKDGETLPTRH